MVRYVAPEADIAAFLRRFREAMETHGLDLWPTPKNRKFEDDTGFTKADAELLVRSLRVIDYATGPEPDDNAARSSGEVWVFGREFEGIDLYLKLKLQFSPHVGGTPSACMSFHPQEYPLKQPHWPQRVGTAPVGRKTR
ncbi:hypothetical protein SAE02_62100 [Skermanella aerolata]|uniref:Toxin n=2 Tax=Skermanella aerolata TaxID=393310 RepID=A0A512E034_9PROT|nr:hypothetical protein N826_25985 [Skermanella aerolata KACC 11604]GEO42062.1 hypothetical protein SAE02_62100 [Skermanella aerolata]